MGRNAFVSVTSIYIVGQVWSGRHAGAKQILAVTRSWLRRRRRSVVIKVVTPPSLRCSPLPRPEHLITRGRAVTLYSYTATTWIIT